MELAKGFLKSIFGREGEAAPLSRRDALAGLGLVGALLAAPKLLALTPAEATPLDKAAEVSGSSPEVAKAGEVDAADAGDATDLSAQRRWRRRYYRPYWRRRYYLRRRYYRPYWRRRYWRRRYWRRRYW
jgi:hypothetical protein